MKIDIRKPLRRGILVEGEDGEEDCWCPIKYEFIPNFCYSCGCLGHVEKECDSCVELEAGCRQFGEWMRVTPSRWKGQGDQRNKWSEGRNSGSGKVGRSKENSKTSLVLDQGRLQSSSLKTSADIDPKLKDDGTSPVKGAVFVPVGSRGTAKCLSFVETMVGADLEATIEKGQVIEEGSLDGAGVAQLVDNGGERSPGHGQTQGGDGAEVVVVAAGGGCLEGGKDMEVDEGVVGAVEAIKGSLLEAVGDQGKELGEQIPTVAEVGGWTAEEVGGGGRKPGSFHRLQRAPSEHGGLKLMETEKKGTKGRRR